MADIHRSESKIPPAAEKLAPILEGLEGIQHHCPAWGKKSFSRPSAEHVGVELEHQDQVSNVSAIDPLTLPSGSNSKSNLLVLDDDKEQAPANEAGSSLTADNGLTNESMCVGQRGGISGTHSNGQSASGGFRSPTAERSDSVVVPPPGKDSPPTRNLADHNNVTCLADSSRSLCGVPMQRGHDARHSGSSTTCRGSDCSESPTSGLLVDPTSALLQADAASALLLLEEGQAHGTRGGAEFASCTTQLHDSSQQLEGAKNTSTSASNTPSTTEHDSKGENIGDFHALLREAMQQSDAELAAEKESACTLKRQLSLPALSEHPPPNQRGDPRETTLQPVIATSNTAENCCRKGSGSSGSDCVSNGAGHMNALSSSSSPTAPLPETAQGQWVRYISPDGHPYLYNEVTGSSQWADPNEEEAYAAADTARTTVSEVTGTEGAGYNGEVRGTDGTGSVDVNVEGREQLAEEEGSSAGTFEASQTSQDTSDPDARNSAGETAMHLAAAQHSVRGLRLLLTGGADVNAIDERGRTPLHAACENCHKRADNRSKKQARESIELLLSRGALEDARDAKGQTPLHISALAGNVSAVQALLVAGATASADAAGNSPLHLAAAQGHPEIMQLLVLGVGACNTHKCSSVSPEEVSIVPKLTPEIDPGSCAATELVTEGTDASGSVNEARYPPEDKRPPHAVGRHPLDRAAADSSSGDEPCGGAREAAFQTSNTQIYHRDATAGTSRRKQQQRWLSGAKHRTQSETHIAPGDFPTSFGADVSMKKEETGTLSVSHPGLEAAAAIALGAGSLSYGVVANSYRDSAYLDRNAELMGEETGVEEYRRDSHEGRREQGNAFETRHAPTGAVSGRVKDNRRNWNGGFSNQSLVRRRHDQLAQLRRGFDPAEVGKNGLYEFETREWSSTKNAGDCRIIREEGDDYCGRKYCLDNDRERQRPEGKGGKEERRSRRRQDSERDDQTIAWPEALSPDRYEQVMDTVLAARGEGCGAPPYSALTEALFAACVASRLDDATAVLVLLEEDGRRASDIVFEGGRTPLHHACRGDDVSLVRLLCRARADPEARDFQGNSPLMVAAATGSTSCLRFLLQGGVDPHGCNNLGDTPLHAAAWHGNLSCAKALVGGGARLSQRNKSGCTAREGLLKAGATFSRGRRPKVIRAILKYLECAEESTTQSKLPTCTSQEGYDSDFTAVTADSRTSPERSNDVDISVSNADISRSQGVYNNNIAGSKADICRQEGIYNIEAVRGQGGYHNEMVRGALFGRLGDTHTAAALGDQEGKGERNWERCKPQEERGVRERQTEGDAVFSRARRRDSNTKEYFERRANCSRTEQSQIQDPYEGGYSTNSALNGDGSLASHASHFEPSRERYNPAYSVAEGTFSDKKAVSQVDGVFGEYDTRRRYMRNTSRRNEILGYSSDCHGSRHEHMEQQEAIPNASTPSRAGGGVWSAVGRALDYMIGGGDSCDAQDGSGSNEESNDCVKARSDRPPTDSELREKMAGMAPWSMSMSMSKPVPRGVLGAGPAGAASGDTFGGPQQVDAPLATESHDTKVPISLTPMQPPPDVLEAMKGRAAKGQRQQFSAPPADVAAAINDATERRQRDYLVHRRDAHGGV